MPQILQHDRRHGHAQRCEIVLCRHFLLPGRITQEAGKATGQILRVTRLVKLDCDLFAFRHLAEIRKIGAKDWHAVGARQMRHSAAAGRGGVRHHRDRRTLEKSGQLLLGHIAGKFDVRIFGALVHHRLDIARSLRMVASPDDEPGIGQSLGKALKGLDHQFQPFVSSPFPESENAMFRIAPAGKIRILRSRR